MGAEKHDSKSGLLQLFGWNAKSRKKSHSTKSTVPELLKQKRRCDGSLPMTLLHLVDEDDILSGSSMKESSDFSCASSVTDEEFSVPKGPNIVARLMGLDSLPTRDVSETRSITYFDTHSLQDYNHHPQKLENRRDYHLISSGNLHVKMEEGINRNFLEKKHQKLSNMPMKKFQTEKLPPKSAKSIPITHHKLLSPIKSANYIPSDDAARIMEAAARITRPTTTNPKLPILAHEEKEVVVVASVQKPWKLPETSCRGRDSNVLKEFKGESMSKSWNGSTDKTSVKGSVESGECSTSTKGKGKSISLALQAKANVQKREGLSSSRGSKTSFARESNELISSEHGTQKGTRKKPSSLGSSNVLRQNNQKQNSYGGDSRKVSCKQPIANGEDSSGARYTCPTKSAENKVVRRSISEVMDGRNEGTRSNSRTTSRKKRSTERNFHGDQAHVNHDTKNEKPIQSQPNKSQGTEVISFTFTSPMTKSYRDRDPESHEKNTGSNDLRGFESREFSVMEGNAVSSDALSTLLDQKLRELTRGLVTSVDNNAGKGETSSSSNQGLMTHETKLRQTDEIASSFSSVFPSEDFQSFIKKHKIQGLNQEMKKYGQNENEAKTVVEYRTPSPVSVLEHSFLEEICNSSDTADTSVAGDSRQSPSTQAQEANSPSTRFFIPLEAADVEFLHSYSSLSTPGFPAKQTLTPSFTDASSSTQPELEYIKKIVHNINLMFDDFASGKTSRIISPQLFIQLECQNGFKNEQRLSMSRRKLLFDFVAEYLDYKCKQHTGGGYEAWFEGVVLMKFEKRLAEEILKEILRLNLMGDCMVDELVDKDMSYKHGGGRWLDFEIESIEVGMEVEDQILNALLDEVIADIL